VPWDNLAEDILEEFLEAQVWHGNANGFTILEDGSSVTTPTPKGSEKHERWSLQLKGSIETGSFHVIESSPMKVALMRSKRSDPWYKKHERKQQNSARARQMLDPVLREWRLLREREALRRYRAKNHSRKSVPGQTEICGIDCNGSTQEECHEGNGTETTE
jgi:hypothetical protein